MGENNYRGIWAVVVVCIILHLLKLGLKKLIKREVIDEEFEDEDSRNTLGRGKIRNRNS